MGPNHMCAVATIPYGCMGFWCHGQTTSVCAGAVKLGLISISIGFDRIGPKQAGLTGKASWFLSLSPKRWTISATWRKWEHLWRTYNVSRIYLGRFHGVGGLNIGVLWCIILRGRASIF